MKNFRLSLSLVLLCVSCDDANSPEVTFRGQCIVKLTDCGEPLIKIPEKVDPALYMDGFMTGMNGPWPFILPEDCAINEEECKHWWDAVGDGAWHTARCERWALDME
jgi:hypothetical protein